MFAVGRYMLEEIMTRKFLKKFKSFFKSLRMLSSLRRFMKKM